MPAYSAPLEKLAEAIATYSGYTDPSGPLYQARNPIGLRATSMKHLTNEQGQRVFNSFIDGMQAALFDLSKKLSGKSWAQLTPESTLEDLASAYSLPSTSADAWSRFLRKAFNDSTVNKKTPLSYFSDTKEIK